MASEMTGEELYEEFKLALNYLGVGFHGMREVTVGRRNGGLVFSANGKECAVLVPAYVSPESQE